MLNDIAVTQFFNMIDMGIAASIAMIVVPLVIGLKNKLVYSQPIGALFGSYYAICWFAFFAFIFFVIARLEYISLIQDIPQGTKIGSLDAQRVFQELKLAMINLGISFFFSVFSAFFMVRNYKE